MKKAISPILLAIVLAVIARIINSEINAVGLVLILCVGLALGALLNKFVFFREDEKNEGNADE